MGEHFYLLLVNDGSKPTIADSKSSVWAGLNTSCHSVLTFSLEEGKRSPHGTRIPNPRVGDLFVGGLASVHPNGSVIFWALIPSAARRAVLSPSTR
jgi:hypothetical protein